MPAQQQEFERIAMPHLAALLRVARRITLDPARAEDLAQETMLLAWRSFRSFEPGSNARAWLFRILFNVFHGEGRKAVLAARQSPIADCVAPPQQAAVEIREALDALPVEKRSVSAAVCRGRIHLPRGRRDLEAAHRDRDVAIEPRSRGIAPSLEADGERSV